MLENTPKKQSHVFHYSLGWTVEHTAAFYSCHEDIIRRKTLTHRDESKILCICTDPSNSHWYLIIIKFLDPFSAKRTVNKTTKRSPCIPANYLVLNWVVQLLKNKPFQCLHKLNDPTS